MRLFLLLLLFAGSGAAEGEVLREARAWRGKVTVRSLSEEPSGGSGREEQSESVEFVLVTEPPRVSVGRPRLEFTMRESEGRYAVRLDTKEPGNPGDGVIVTKGGDEGNLHVAAGGWFHPDTGECHLAVRAQPATFAVMTTLSGIVAGRFQTHRTVATRGSFLAAFVAKGRLEADGRTFRGSRTLVDKAAPLRREVVVEWVLERIDPRLTGRVVDGAGRPLGGLSILARTTNADRVRRKLPPILLRGETDAHGRFVIDAYCSFWRLELLGKLHPTEGGTLLVAGREVEAGVDVRFDSAPESEISLEVFRLEELPDPELLAGGFGGDVKAYLRHLRARYPAERLAAALAP
ncbi:MAG: hypothetical protein ACT4PV_06020 [Planctomycetaceae bacterium]